MHDLKWIRDNAQAFDAALAKRGLEPQSPAILKLDEERRHHLTALQEAQSQRNAASKAIGKAKASGNNAEAQRLIDEVAKLKTVIQEGEERERQIDQQLNNLLAGIPNLPLEDVPVGADESANVELRRWGETPNFSFTPKQHFEIGEALGLMDFETAAKISGARFVVLKGALARLERAIASFMLDIHTGEFGYMEVQPPVLVRDEAMFGTGQLPKFLEDQFSTFPGPVDLFEDKSALSEVWNKALDAAATVGVEKARNAEFTIEGLEFHKERRWLIPTAEVPLTNLVRESVLEEAELPRRVTAWTPCFRAEAGAAGKDTRGMIRQHQFSKVELVSITTPEHSLDELERMSSCAEEILKRLGLAYRVMLLSTGDMGFGARKTYDLEVWLPGQDTYREISSCSVCGDFQARRMNARYRVPGEKELRFVHTLNGSGLAVGRTLIAVLENYQQEDGSVIIPDPLRSYMGGLQRIAASEAGK